MKQTLILGLITIAFSITSCTFNVGTSSNTPTAKAPNTTNSVPTTADNKPATTTNAAAPKSDDSASGADSSSETGSEESEKIQFAKGQSSVDLDIQLEGKATKKYVAFVAKGFMTCVMPETSLGSSITIKVNGKVHNPDNGPCTAHSTKAGDQIIEFINNGGSVKNITVSISFNQHG